MAIQGIRRSLPGAFDFPIRVGQCLRSTTRQFGRGDSCPPRPSAGVALIPDWDRMARIGGGKQGDAIILIGGDGSPISGQSAWMRDCLGRAEGAPPSVGPDGRNAAIGDFVPLGIRNDLVTSCHEFPRADLPQTTWPKWGDGVGSRQMEIGLSISPQNLVRPMRLLFRRGTRRATGGFGGDHRSRPTWTGYVSGGKSAPRAPGVPFRRLGVMIGDKP